MPPTSDPPGGGDAAPRRWRMLALVAVAELLGMSAWFTAAAVAPQLRERWDLSGAESAWLTAIVQLGFVCGTAAAAILNLADIVPTRIYFASCAALAGLANASLLLVPGYGAALASRFFTGFFLAGVYPPAMKMAATWFRSWRGLAIGIVVGALVVGKAMPYLAHALDETRIDTVVLAASIGALVGGALVLFGFREGPLAFERPPFSWSLASIAWRDRRTRLAIGGYLGHMWELYAMWAWTPAFIAASMAAREAAGGPAVDPRLDDLLSFGSLAAGGLGCVWAGWAARRLGYARVVQISMAASGLCSLAIGLCFGGDPWLLGAVALVWGFFVVADSAQFSAMVTESAPPHAVGTVLTLQVSTGFLLTMATIQAVPWLASIVGWQWAFAVLAIGPAAGIAAIRRLAR